MRNKTRAFETDLISEGGGGAMGAYQALVNSDSEQLYAAPAPTDGLGDVSAWQAPSEPRVLAGNAILPDVVRRVVTRLLAQCEGGVVRLDELLFETVYQEERRLAHAATDARTQADAQFVDQLRHRIARGGDANLRELLHSVVLRYCEEISGHFTPGVYRFATRALPPALAALMHGGRLGPELFRVQDRILIEGELDALRAATTRGTVVLVPTHTSNLDSLLLGYTIFALGLPPFAYGAGLNLFGNRLTGYFMRNLGAFTVDRQKTDPVYRAALKEYMILLLERGQHVLFFPGGTRSRAGAVETHLKLGLLGTAITAFRNLQRSPRPHRIFIVPCALSYPLVLEAASLVSEYLRSEGGPHYLELTDEFEHPARWYDFLRRLTQLDVRVHLRFGRPLDILGNPVDLEGVSRGPCGRALDPSGYLRVDGVVADDAARDAEYTRVLAERVVNGYRRLSVALPSSVVAFAVFEHLRLRFPQLDIFRLLQAISQHPCISFEEVVADVDRAVGQLRDLTARGALVLAPELRAATAPELIAGAVATLSSYHRVPALTQHSGSIQVGDPGLLFYYRNRLDGFGLLGSPTLQQLLLRRERPS